MIDTRVRHGVLSDIQSNQLRSFWIDVFFSVATHHTEGAEWRLNTGRFEQTVVGLVCGISLIGQMLAVSDYLDAAKRMTKSLQKKRRSHDERVIFDGSRSVIEAS